MRSSPASIGVLNRNKYCRCFNRRWLRYGPRLVVPPENFLNRLCESAQTPVALTNNPRLLEHSCVPLMWGTVVALIASRKESDEKSLRSLAWNYWER